MTPKDLAKRNLHEERRLAVHVYNHVVRPRAQDAGKPPAYPGQEKQYRIKDFTELTQEEQSIWLAVARWHREESERHCQACHFAWEQAQAATRQQPKEQTDVE